MNERLNRCFPFHIIPFFLPPVAFKIYDMDNDGYISNGELFQVLKLMVGSNLKDTQLQQVCIYSLHDTDIHPL